MAAMRWAPITGWGSPFQSERAREAFEFELGRLPAAGAREHDRWQAVDASLMEGGGQSREELVRVLCGAGIDVHIHEG